MRVLWKVQIPVESGNEAVGAGTVGKTIQTFAGRARPEAVKATGLL